MTERITEKQVLDTRFVKSVKTAKSIEKKKTMSSNTDANSRSKERIREAKVIAKNGAVSV